MEYIDIGPAPGAETCAQVGTPNYSEDSARECRTFIRMLHRLFPIPAGLLVEYVSRTHAHDFGSYREVAIRFANTRGAEFDFASGVEVNVPTQWDSVARYELLWLERRDAYRAAVRSGTLLGHDVPVQYAANQMPPLPQDAHLGELLSRFPI